jgi:hypothetical protein
MPSIPPPPPPHRPQYKPSHTTNMWQHDLQHLEKLCYVMVKLPMINLSHEFIFIIITARFPLVFRKRVAWISSIPGTICAIYLLIQIPIVPAVSNNFTKIYQRFVKDFAPSSQLYSISGTIILPFCTKGSSMI